MGAPEFISIFNDVLGPVMRGPSSSHTAGAFRIARMCRMLAGELPAGIICTFDPDGSYAPTYKPLGVDVAFAAGLIDRSMTDAGYDRSPQVLRELGTKLEFAIRTIKHADHPNSVLIEYLGSDNINHELYAKSTGGGVVELYRFDDFEISISGKAGVILIETQVSAAPELTTRIEGFTGCQSDSMVTRGEATLLSYQIEKTTLADTIRNAALDTGLVDAAHAWRIDPLFYPENQAPPFESGAEILSESQSSGLCLGDLGIQYETSVLGVTPEKAEAEMMERYRIMVASVAEGLSSKAVHMDILKPSAPALMDNIERGTLPVRGAPGRAAVRAMAAMHTCNSRGVVCAAPTGGSAGVIPGVIISLEEELGLSEEMVSRGLFAAGLVGMVVARRATFAAETAGCQVEIGVAGAMAAAAVVDIYGGNAETALNAAAISLQNTMGSVCDPVKGGCEVPCHTRNAVSASSAFTCAALAMGGYDNLIPFDQTVDASFEVGKALPRELRCTALGGIAVTPAALEL